MHRARRLTRRHTVGALAAVVSSSALLLGGCTIGDVSEGGDPGAPEQPGSPVGKPAPGEDEDMAAEPEPGAETEESGEPANTDPTSPGARGLAVGDCVADLDALSGTDELEVPDCEDPHAGEVFAQWDITGKTLFPGNEELGREAGDICGGEDFDNYVGVSYAGSALDVITMMPSKDSWPQGDRTVTCVVTDPAVEETDGTLHQSSR